MRKIQNNNIYTIKEKRGDKQKSMNYDINKKKEFIINFIYWLIIFLIGFVIIKYASSFLIPFTTGFIIAFLLIKPINIISTKLYINKTIISILCVSAFYAVVAYLLFLISLWGYSTIQEFILKLSSVYTDNVETIVMNISQYLKESVEFINWEGEQDFNSIINEMSSSLISAITSFISDFSKFIFEKASGIIQGVPSTLIKLVLTIISSFFIAIDYDVIMNFVHKQIKPETAEIINKIKSYLVGTVWVCIRSYAIIMFITFIELSIGLTILGVKNSIIWAVGISMLDILPVLGTGTAVIPWGIISLILGNTQLGIGLLIMYAIITVIRNIIEPKIVGKQLGLHPLITLISMFIGVNVAGIFGLFGFPIGISLILYLNREGTIHILNTNN